MSWLYKIDSPNLGTKQIKKKQASLTDSKACKTFQLHHYTLVLGAFYRSTSNVLDFRKINGLSIYDTRTKSKDSTLWLAESQPLFSCFAKWLAI